MYVGMNVGVGKHLVHLDLGINLIEVPFDVGIVREVVPCRVLSLIHI